MNSDNSAKGHYIGLSQVSMTDDHYDLGKGIYIEKIYAHFMAPYLMAFKPAEPGKLHPTPWKSGGGGKAFDITAQLYTPNDFTGSIIVFLLRVWINPEITAPVLSTHSFLELPSLPDTTARIGPYEVQDRSLALRIDNGDITQDSIHWVRVSWPIAVDLIEKSSGFRLLTDSLSLGQFVQNTSLMIVSLWSGLEAIFSPSTTELKFRLSSLISAFLHKPGEERLKIQKLISKLYDKRSLAAHGRPAHATDDLVATFELARRVIIRIIVNGKVPSKDDLESLLFGCVY